MDFKYVDVGRVQIESTCHKSRRWRRDEKLVKKLDIRMKERTINPTSNAVEPTRRSITVCWTESR
ncbi:hypothetical protein T265_06239 [Opisthorchis viverrini]|uniref:Uncharacterized protein n=1 Tax=Opisthorchis viverrini TaxID=6198 RepID=A0A074ZT12_OPIVI|nr:hypothetical protein T265_06239 [Opisthorchis viverrini]KER26520.1 hypothetical protein T265_06239 [Opisthorchis viverrini]